MRRSVYLVTGTLFALLTACSGDSAKNATASAVSKAVEVAKGAATGIEQGAEKGRKASDSVDGARIVSNGTELKAALTGEVLSVKGKGPAEVTLGFANASTAPVRVVDLASKEHFTALDSEGFACTVDHADDEFTVPAKAKLKVVASITCSDKPIAMVRLFDVEYPVAGDRIKAQ